MEFTMKESVTKFAGFAAIALTLTGCAARNPHDTAGFFRILVTERGCIAGKVTDSITGRAIPGATLEVVPAIPGARVSTDQGGFFYAEFPGGNYSLRFATAGYRPAEKAFLLKPGDTAGWDVSLDPTAPVIVNAGETLTGAAPGSTVTLKAEVIIRDGSTLKEIRWEARRGEGRVAARINDGKGREVKVTLPGINAYKASLLYRLGKDGRLLDRWEVVGIVPDDLREAGGVTIKATATTSSGTYTDSVDIVADLESFAGVNPGLQNVVIGKPLLLQGKSGHAYAWSLVGPSGSSALLKDATTRNPSFIPDIPGTYSIREGNEARLTIYAGLWVGAVFAKENEPKEKWGGLKGCYCHYGGRVSSKFAAWRDSGHAEIFTRCVNTVFRYDEQCTRCHSVGFAGKTTDGGITSAPGYSAFRRDAAVWDQGKVPPLVIPKPTNFDYISDTYPDVARLANVQCENCHGPNNSEAHKSLTKTGAPARISLNPEVCGVCHVRSRGDLSYEQWYESKHSNYNLAIETGTVVKRGESAGDCGRCHTGQGFIAWLGGGKRTAIPPGASMGNAAHDLATLGLTEEKVLPITCAVCHDPHAPGNSFRSGKEKIPVRGGIDTARLLPAEFSGEQPGRGSLCVTCHSTVGGPRNDSIIPRLNSAFMPHATQADVLFGQNAFFIEPGAYKSHTRIEDTCIWCHVKPVPKPSESGYPRGGVNHSFRAGVGLCSECHKGFDRDELMDATNGDMEILKKELEEAIKTEMVVRGGIRLAGRSKSEAETTLSANTIREVSLMEMAKEMGVEITTTTSNSYKVSLADIKEGDTLLMETATGQLILKAAWNYFLVKNDGSSGVHNPRYVSEVLAATIGRLRGLRRE
jgi:formate-dependent nitrite reductase cytochrome c552 subunit